jgi:anti-sigma regulatory factor (Ser/Thr protein kinase)
MAKQMTRAQIQLSTDECIVRRVTDWIGRFCERQRLSRAITDAVSLSLEEIVSNIAVHGYEGRPGKLSIEAHYDPRAFSVVIEDGGKPFDPTQTASTTFGDTLSSRSEGGLGLLLVKSLMDEIVYHRAGATNRLKLMKRL